MSTALGIDPFADELQLPANMLYSTRLCGHGHDEGGKVIRYKAGGQCVACMAQVRARSRGKLAPENSELTHAQIVTRAKADARHKQAKPTSSKRHAAHTRTDVPCETCAKPVAAIVVRKHEEIGAGLYCSRACDPAVCWKVLRRTGQEKPAPREGVCRWCRTKCWEVERAYGKDAEAEPLDAELVEGE